MNPISRLAARGLALLLPVLFLLFASGAAMAQADPPGRVAGLSWRDGSVVFAPEGENEWVDLPLNRPLTRGDRMWTDRGARAELHMGSATLHVDGQSHLAFYELDDDALQLSLTQGTVAVRVRELAARENFEIDTPNLAVRALQPGAWRVDVDPGNGTTRVAVRGGQVVVYGERGESLRLAGGQQAVFAGRGLQQVGGAYGGFDAFDSWAAERNRFEDRSVSARYLPREVIGYYQLDSYGSWGQDPAYGAVWYPRITVADWAPYRYGHWAWINPWGWTWIDDAPWGFAPFHYGRWARIGARWAWVPGQLGPRPVYAPALVVFVGGSGGVNWSIGIGSDPGIAWYPLAPGEVWWPTYRTTNVYVNRINYNLRIDRDRRDEHREHFRTRSEAITAVPVNDFNRGRPVREHWQRVQPSQIANAPVVNSIASLPRPAGLAPERREAAPRLQAPAPSPVQPAVPGRGFAPPGLSRPVPAGPAGPAGGAAPVAPVAPAARPEDAGRPRGAAPGVRGEAPAVRQDAPAPRGEVTPPARGDAPGLQRAPGLQQAPGLQRDREEQERQQQERAQRDAAIRQQQDQARQQQQQEQQRQQQERAQRDAVIRQQQEQVRQQQDQARQQQERAAREQERIQREQERLQRDAATRQQQEAVRQQQEQARQQQERAAREQERLQREQERLQREQQRQPAAPRVPVPQAGPPAAQGAPAAAQGEHRAAPAPRARAQAEDAREGRPAPQPRRGEDDDKPRRGQERDKP